MAGDVRVAVQQFTAPTVTGNQDYTISGLGWTPKGIWAFATYATTNDTRSAGMGFGYGAADGTNEWACGATDQNGQANSDTDRYHTDAACVLIPVNDGSQNWNRASFVSFISDGVRLSWDDAPGAAVKFTLVFFGGVDFEMTNGSVTLGSASTSSDITTVGFQPTGVLAATSSFATTPPANTTNCTISVGFSDGTNNNGLFYGATNGQGTTIQGVEIRNDVCYSQRLSNSAGWKGSIGSFDADGFTISVDATGNSNDLVFYSAINTDTLGVFLGSGTMPSSTVSDWSVTGFGFEPQFVALATSEVDSLNTINTGSGTEHCVFGFTDFTRDSSVGWTSDDAATTTNCDSFCSDKFIWAENFSGAAQQDFGLPTADSGGFTVAAADITTADANAYVLFAIEKAAEGSTVSLTGQSSTVGQGSVSVQADFSTSLTGQVSTVNQGSVSISSDQVLSVVGQAATANQGSPSAGPTEFPQTSNPTVTTNSTGSTSPAINLPSASSGDLLLMLVALGNANGQSTIITSGPSGWEVLESSGPVAVYAKVATGSEGSSTSLTVVFASTIAAHVYKVTDWYGDISGVESALATGAGTTPNSPSNTASWGSDDNLWFSFFGAFNDDISVTAYPASYTDTFSDITGGGTNNGASVGSCRRELASATEDPSSFTLADNEGWRAITVVVAPQNANVPPNLVGQESTVAQGSLSTVIDFSTTLTGQASTANQGPVSIIANYVETLLGQASTTALGDVLLSTSSTTSLMGLQSATNQGSLAVSISFEVSLSGLSSSTNQGSLEVVVPPVLTGQASVSSIGALTTSRSSTWVEIVTAEDQVWGS